MTRSGAVSTEALAIVEKYEAFVRYLYPILQRSPRQHGVLRDVVLAALFPPIGGLYHAARSRQVSRLHAVDAEFATLRSHLRFLVSPAIRVLTPHQHVIALSLLSEPGKMLGAWQRKLTQHSVADRRHAPEQAEHRAAVANGAKQRSGADRRLMGQAGK